MIPKADFLRKYDIKDEDFNATGLEWSELEKIYEDHDSLERKDTLEGAASYLIKLLRRSDKMHSLKFRIKDPEHLIEKIIRKRREDVENGKPLRDINLNNYRDKITDLIGIRALHLYKGDWLAIHTHINATWDLHSTPIANIRKGDPEDIIQQFEENGCEINEHKYGYRSIHYVIESQLGRDLFLAEIQVRTIFEEGWSEIDHLIRYPYEQKNPILVKYLVMFSRLAGSADEMASFINGLKTELRIREERYRSALSSLKEKERLLSNFEGEIEQLKIEKQEKERLQEIVNSLAERLGESVESIAEASSDSYRKGILSVDDALKGKSDTYDRAKIRDYWNERLKPGGKGMACTRSNLSKDTYNRESQKLIAHAMVEAKRLLDSLSVGGDPGKPARLLEVGLGYGDMTEELVPECNARRIEYYGVDCSDTVVNKVRQRLVSKNIPFEAQNVQEAWADELKFDDAFFDLIVWGRIGHHIPSDNVWTTSLSQLKRVLKPGGYILHFEALLDFNNEDMEQPRRHEFTQLRFKKDYQKVLSPISILQMTNLPVGDETYTIATWKKPVM